MLDETQNFNLGKILKIRECIWQYILKAKKYIMIDMESFDDCNDTKKLSKFNNTIVSLDDTTIDI